MNKEHPGHLVDQHFSPGEYFTITRVLYLYLLKMAC